MEITFCNKVDIKVQAQVFDGRTLVSTCVAAPGESRVMPVSLVRYDIFLKNGATGWGLAYRLDSDARTLTLSLLNGRYVIT